MNDKVRKGARIHGAQYMIWALPTDGKWPNRYRSKKVRGPWRDRSFGRVYKHIKYYSLQSEWKIGYNSSIYVTGSKPVSDTFAMGAGPSAHHYKMLGIRAQNRGKPAKPKVKYEEVVLAEIAREKIVKEETHEARCHTLSYDSTTGHSVWACQPGDAEMEEQNPVSGLKIFSVDTCTGDVREAAEFGEPCLEDNLGRRGIDICWPGGVQGDLVFFEYRPETRTLTSTWGAGVVEVVPDIRAYALEKTKHSPVPASDAMQGQWTFDEESALKALKAKGKKNPEKAVAKMAAKLPSISMKGGVITLTPPGKSPVESPYTVESQYACQAKLKAGRKKMTFLLRNDVLWEVKGKKRTPYKRVL